MGDVVVHSVSTARFKELLGAMHCPRTMPHLRRARRKWRVSVHTLAAVSGYSSRTIKHYEGEFLTRTGAVSKPSATAVRDLWEALGVLIAEKRAWV